MTITNAAQVMSPVDNEELLASIRDEVEEIFREVAVCKLSELDELAVEDTINVVAILHAIRHGSYDDKFSIVIEQSN